MPTLATHLRLARVSNTPTVLSNLVLGFGIAGGLAMDSKVFLGALAIVLFYTGGMYLNDFFDADYDSRHQNYRPIPAGEISRSAVGIIGLAQLLVACLMLSFYGLNQFYLGLALASGILVYDISHKSHLWSILFMAFSRALVYVIGASLLGYGTALAKSHIVILAIFLAVYVLGLTWIARRAEDNEVSLTLPGVLLFAPIILLALDWNTKTGTEEFWYLPVSMLLWTSSCVYWIIKKKYGLGIGGLIAGIALFDAMILADRAASWTVYFCLSMFFLTLALQRFIRGT